MRSLRDLFPHVAARRVWGWDGTPVWEFRVTSRPSRPLPPPVEQAAPVVPFVFAVDLDGIASCQPFQAGGQVHVVGNEQSYAGIYADNEPLVP